MVIQAIALLDDLDKEINIYSMRVKVSYWNHSRRVRSNSDQEWYGWHFPEMGKIIVDNLAYAKVVKAMGEFIAFLHLAIQLIFLVQVSEQTPLRRLSR